MPEIDPIFPEEKQETIQNSLKERSSIPTLSPRYHQSALITTKLKNLELLDHRPVCAADNLVDVNR